MEHPLQVVQHAWSLPVHQEDKAKALSAKFKNLRRVLKAWRRQISSLKRQIDNVKLILTLLDSLEQERDLTLEEWNFKEILNEHLISLLNQQRIYWKQRGMTKWVKLGDETTKKIHANATIRHRRNSIAILKNDQGVTFTNHTSKADLLWEAYKDRLGQTNFEEMYFDLDSL